MTAVDTGRAVAPATTGSAAVPAARSAPPEENPDASAILATTRALVEPALRAAVATLPASLATVVGYHLGWVDAAGRALAADGGKALRPALALATARAVGGNEERAVPAAVAVELVHNFSLLHDDVMDGDRLRRHRPTAWTVFGTPPALLAGNALLALALDVVAGDPGTTRLLTAAVQDLLDGQAADLAFERRPEVSLDECRRMADGKTGALLGCACALGGRAAGVDEWGVARLDRFGRRLGLAFQFADDLLGIWGDPEVTGKPAHSDLASRKKSLPVVAALRSGAASGDELAELYRRDGELSAEELAHAADLVELAGGRAYARREADAVYRLALADLASVASGREAELAALARLAAHRDR